MTIYTCPMHPDVQQEHSGKCPICDMKLVVKDSHAIHNDNTSSYTPLIVIVGLLLFISIIISMSSGFSLVKIVETFMIGFFLVFSGFKFLDLPGFAEGYATYDLLAQRAEWYGYIYPFIELFFAVAMILSFQIQLVLVAEIVVMTFSGVGVAIKLAKHEKFQCSCLGTFLKVPLTNVTLIEDFGMAALAIFMLVSR